MEDKTREIETGNIREGTKSWDIKKEAQRKNERLEKIKWKKGIGEAKTVIQRKIF